MSVMITGEPENVEYKKLILNLNAAIKALDYIIDTGRYYHLEEFAKTRDRLIIERDDWQSALKGKYKPKPK